ncbi:hypothetical protein ACIRP3_44035 [Streptomyces sp. NPDC101209]|uniref:hypothetical protein n=1 Tax=Streptomyces sp. NPDC101209 TaxID=3366129 RepID=UPI00380E6B7D
MTKAGASGPKARARKAQHATGSRYTQLRGSGQPRRGRVVQFLFENRQSLGSLPWQLAAVWARAGERVLLLAEYKPYGADMQLYSRRAKQRKAAEARAQAWPGPRSTVLWTPPAGRGNGVLASQHTAWETPRDPGRPECYQGSLKQALALARAEFDIVVLLATPTWARTEFTDHFVLLAHSDGIPTTEALAHWHHGQSAPIERALTPAQSAALLRDRHLRFLYPGPVPFLGMIACRSLHPTRSTPDPGAGFIKSVKEDMAAAGIPLLGLVSFAHRDLQALTRRDRDPAAAITTPFDQGVEQAAHAVRAHWR